MKNFYFVCLICLFIALRCESTTNRLSQVFITSSNKAGAALAVRAAETRQPHIKIKLGKIFFVPVRFGSPCLMDRVRYSNHADFQSGRKAKSGMLCREMFSNHSNGISRR
jgi:hypothetical protein